MALMVEYIIVRHEKLCFSGQSAVCLPSVVFVYLVPNFAILADMTLLMQY